MIALNWYLISHDLSVKYVINIYVNIFNAKLSYFLKLRAPAPNWHSGCELGDARDSSPGPCSSGAHPDSVPRSQETEGVKPFTRKFSNTQLRTVEGTPRTRHTPAAVNDAWPVLFVTRRFLLSWIKGKPGTGHFIVVA